MRITQPEPVTRTYCDNCGKEAGLPRYGIDGKDIGKCCVHIWDERVRKNRIASDIKDQPFYA